jgi:DNA-binding CsgD family transcriptional regulator/tetratricopeptide (TPR) repeat protein
VTPAAVPMPRDLAAPAPVPFVARDEAWSLLSEAWADTTAGARRVALVAGEVGAGKTRLVAEFARFTHAEGAVVLHGACPEGARVPYAPFREAIGWLLQWASAASIQVDDDLRDRLTSLTTPRTSGARRTIAVEDERYVVADAVAELLEVASDVAPVVLVIDDIHWAGSPILDLLDDLTRGARPGRCLLLVTHRTEAADLSPEARACLSDLRRRAGAVRVGVPRFDEAGIRAFVEAAAGHRLHVGLERVVGFLAAETEGNAFFLGELWRHLTETGRLVRPGSWWRLDGRFDIAPSPPTVRDVVASRLQRLPDSTRRALDTAAIIGTVFSHDVLARAAGRSPAELLGDLEPAQSAGVVEELHPGTGRFAHALVRRAAYDEQRAESRHERHLAVARAIEATGSAGQEVVVASHLLAAVPLVDRREAIDAARGAARSAFDAGRHADAGATLRAALDLVGDGVERGQLLLRLAEANMRAGDVAGAESAALEAHDLGVTHDDHRLAVDGALVHAEAIWRAALPGDVSLEVIGTALGRAADPLDVLRLRSGRARALALSGRDPEARVEAQIVLAEARSAGDLETLRAAYFALLFTAWTPETTPQLLDAARDFADLAVSAGVEEWELAALDKVLLGLLITGDLDAARHAASRHHVLAARVGQPLFRVLDHQARALLAVGEGRFADAESEATAANELGGFLSGRDASGGFGVQMFSLRREQGRLDEARPMVEMVAQLGQESDTWRPALAVLYAELGLHAEATALLDDLAATSMQSIPRDSLWPAALVYLTEATVRVGHQRMAKLLRDELRPHQGTVVVAGTFLAAYGAADRYLGVLAAVCGDRDAATEHLETALRLETAARMPVWVARTQVALGRVLAGSVDPPAVERGLTLLRFAQDIATRIGMASLRAEIREVLDGTPTPSRSRGGAGAELTDRELAVLRLLAEGCSNREIGERLHISHHTAANHIRAILIKSGCRNRTEAASWALRLGLSDG